MNTSFISRFPPLVKNFGLGMFLLGATLALGVVLSSQAVGTVIATRTKSGQTIRVKGVSEITVISDSGHWSGVVTASGNSTADAFSKLDPGVAKVQAVITTNQFTAEEITMSNLDVTPVYTKNEKGVVMNKVDYYVATQTINVTSARVNAIADLQMKVSNLLKEGIKIASGDPQYTCGVLEAVKMELLEKATQNGFNRAQLLAKSSGSKVGALANASQGVFQIVPFGSNEVSDYGMNDVSSIKKSAKAVVSMEYLIDK
jgi:uncharacterized protein